MLARRLDSPIHAQALLPWQIGGGVDKVEDNNRNEDGRSVNCVKRPLVIPKVALGVAVKVDGSEF